MYKDGREMAGKLVTEQGRKTTAWKTMALHDNKPVKVIESW